TSPAPRPAASPSAVRSQATTRLPPSASPGSASLNFCLPSGTGPVDCPPVIRSTWPAVSPGCCCALKRESSAPQETVGYEGVTEQRDEFQRFTRAERHAVDRVFGDGHGDAGRLPQQFVKVVEQRAAAGHDDAPVDD